MEVRSQESRKHIFAINGSPEFLNIVRKLFQEEHDNVTTTNYLPNSFDQIRHGLLSPLTTISAWTQPLARDIRRSPSLSENERVQMLTSITAIETAVQTQFAVIDAMVDG